MIAAPSGWGKTIAAAHYAQASDLEVLWVDAFGAPFELDALAEVVRDACVERLEQLPEGRTKAPVVIEPIVLLAAAKVRVLLVIDDIDLTADAVKQLGALQRRVSLTGSQILVTTRSTAVDQVTTPHVSVLTIPDLRLDVAEAQAIDGLHGDFSDVSVTEHVLEQSGGHVALYTLMSGAVAQGLSPGDTARVDAWIRRLVDQGFTKAETRVLERAALIRHGCASELLGMEPEDASVRLTDMAGRLPLFRVLHERSGLKFSVHDMALAPLLSFLEAESDETARRLMGWAIDTLWARDDHQRIAEILLRFGDVDSKVRWLRSVSQDIVHWVAPRDICALIESLPLHVVMDSPRILSLWANAIYSSGDPRGAIAKAKAACRLAEFQDDEDGLVAAQIVWVDALCRLQQFDEAAELVQQVCKRGSVAARLAGAAVTAAVYAYVGRLKEAHEVASSAQDLIANMSEREAHELDMLRVSHTLVNIEMLMTGDFLTYGRRVAALLPRASRWPTDSFRIRGNLGLGLVEVGRLDRAIAALQPLLEGASEDVVAHYFVFLACALMGLGRGDQAIAVAHESLRLGCKHGFEADLACNRLYVSTMLRAVGEFDAALDHAERALERLCIINYVDYASLAALEVAASLLSLGDVAGARRWAQQAESQGFGENRYKALRAAMILAECDRLSGDLKAGIDRLALHREHILSESSNWQMAMYVRAFPALLGMLAAAVGADDLPVHMLRMLLPEHARQSLKACEGWLPADEWRRLGERTLGAAEFQRQVSSDTDQLCRVRLFGGLEVTVGNRVVSAREWKKGKARLLFAMLVAKRGQDVPRDQVFEHLWPDLDAERARNNLYVVWSTIKGALLGRTGRDEVCPFLDNKGGRLRIDPARVRSDLDEFEDIIAEAREAVEMGEPERAVDAYARLSLLYRGDLLPGDVYDDWFASVRETYRIAFVDAMLDAAELLLDRGEPSEALSYARRAHEVDPLREDAYQACMRCNIATGNRSGAIETFLQLKNRLADELGLDPSAESMALHQQVLVMEEPATYGDWSV